MKIDLPPSPYPSPPRERVDKSLPVPSGQKVTDCNPERVEGLRGGVSNNNCL